MYYRQKYLILFFLLCLNARKMCAQTDSSLVPFPDSLAGTPYQIENGLPAIAEPVTASANSIEYTSYALYTEKNWKKLAAYCEQAFAKQVDYFYLRVRAGIAYFEMEQYRKAIVHLKKALAFNSGDDFTNTYLYYAYLYAERPEEAKKLTRSFGKALSETMRVGSMSPVDFVLLESGIKVPDSSRQFKNAFFTDVGIGHSIGKKIFLQHNFTYFEQGEERFGVKQIQYYLKATLPLKNDFLVSGGIHLVDVTANLRSYPATVVTNTLLFYPVGPPGMPPPPAQVVSYTTNIYSEKITAQRSTNIVGALTISKQTLYADFSAGLTAASFDSTYQYQAATGLNIYPLKNNRLALGATVYAHVEDGGKVNIALAPVVSVYPTKRTHLSLAYLENTGPNISENTGSFVSNSIDYTGRRITATCSVRVAGGTWLYGTYGYEEKKHLQAGYRYDYNIFVAGIRIIPVFK